MSLSLTVKTFLISLVAVGLFFVLGMKSSFAQIESPPPGYQLCDSTFDLQPDWDSTPWVYEIGGLSRSRTGLVITYDYYNGEQVCGTSEETQTEYAYCSGGEFPETFWSSEENIDAVPGQCQGDPVTTTICYQGETLEVELELLGQYEGSEPGSCSTPTPEPTPDTDVCDNIEGVQTSLPEGQHFDAGGQNCVNFDQPGAGDSGGGTTSTGQVLGASTLAATGDGNSKLGLAFMILGSTLAASSFYVLKRRSI